MGEPLIVIGNGMAAARFVEELTSRTLGRFAIAVVGEESRPAYNRVLLSALLAREVESADLALKPERWWRDRGVTLLYGDPAVSIDPAIRRVRLKGGASLPYTRLVLATGSRPIVPSIPGTRLKGVLTFRNFSDVDAIRRLAAAGTRAVVVGGGLLGLEAAYGLAKAGADVTVVHLMDRLMERQLDVRAAAMLAASMESRGIRVFLSAETACVEGRKRAEAVRLTDGRRIEADLVIFAVGVRPDAALARAAGIRADRGIVVDGRMQTSIPGIFAIGECAEHCGTSYGLVEPVHEQASILARNLAGEDVAYAGSILATNLKVSGVNVFSAGDFLGAEGTETIILSDPGLGTYKKLVIRGERLAGAVLFGDTADGLWYLDLIRSGASIERIRGDLAFGRALAERMAA